MGKAQSKRSVDITTETKKGVDDEVTEKMEKIEDVDKKDINGDATVQSHSEKKEDNDDVENDKDITTEKSADVHTSGETTDDVKPPTDESNKEDDTTEEISPLSDENVSKKSKKEKVKKKWSFRSISFGKKDKQKPGKTEEASENASATVNGTDEEKTSPESDESQKEQTSADNTPDGTSKVIHENGNATEPEMNGQQTEEKSDDVKQNEETANTNIPIAENNDLVTNDTAAIITSQETEKSSNVTSKPEVIENDTNSDENTADETSKIGNSVEEVNRTVQQSTADDASVETTAENKNIPADVETEAISVNGTVDEIHQNGTNNVCDREDDQTKAQIEVNINTDKTSADTLEIISSSTSNNPSNAPVNFQNLNASGATLDDVGVENDVQKQVSRDLNESGHNNEIAKNGENNIVDTVQSKVDECVDEKFGDEPSPPPLPISPPPSQVSVFAFTNNEEPVDDSLEKSEPINTHLEETTENVPLPTPGNSAQELNNENKNSEITHSISSISTNLENICLSNEEVADGESIGETNTENKEDNTTNQSTNEQLCTELESLEDGVPEVKECEEMAPSESSNNERESLKDDVTDVVDVEKQNSIKLIENENENENENEMKMKMKNENENEISLTNSITVCGENHENANELQKQSQDNCQASANADNINSVHEITNNSPESLSSTILNVNDVDSDCLPPLNTHDKAPDNIETISNKIDNLVREETKEFANPKDLKESATVAEVKQEPSVTCE